MSASFAPRSDSRKAEVARVLLFYVPALAVLCLFLQELLTLNESAGYPWGCAEAGPRYANIHVYRSSLCVQVLWISASILLFAARRLHGAFGFVALLTFALWFMSVRTGAIDVLLGP